MNYKDSLKNKYDFILLIFALIIVYYCNHATSTFFKGTLVFKLLFIVAIGIWLLGTIILNNTFVKKVLFLLLPIIAAEAIVYLTAAADGGKHSYYLSALENNILILGIMSCLCVYYLRPQYKRERIIIVKFWALDYLIAGIYTLMRLQENPLFSRLLSTANAEEYLGTSKIQGVLTHTNAYGIVFVILALLYIVLAKKTKHVIIDLLVIAFFIFLEIKMQFTMALVFLAIGIIFIVEKLLCQSKSRGKIIFPIIIVLFVVLSPVIIKLVISTGLFADTINVRLEEILNFISFSSIKGSDMGSRFDYYGDSLGAFFKNYCLGYMMGSASIGGHSELLDLLGACGIVTFVLVVTVFVVYLRILKKELMTVKDHGAYFIIFIVYLLQCLFNTSGTCAVTTGIILIAPFIICSVPEKEKNIVNLYTTCESEMSYENIAN